jgi:hypothetical protein
MMLGPRHERGALRSGGMTSFAATISRRAVRSAAAASVLVVMFGPSSVGAWNMTSSAGIPPVDEAHQIAHAQRALVTVQIRFTTCRTCGVQMQTLLNGHEWLSHWKRAHHREITFRVSERHARGSVFLIRAPWVGALSYQPLVAMRYRGFSTGDVVPNRDAMKAKRGTACWVGTSDTATLAVRTARFRTTTTAGSRTTGIRAWTRHTKPKLGQYLLTDHGAVATQDTVPCGNP